MPYLQYYDLVFGALVVAWLWQEPAAMARYKRLLLVASVLLLMLPIVTAPLSHLTGLAFGPLFIVAIFIISLRPRPA